MVTQQDLDDIECDNGEVAAYTDAGFVDGRFFIMFDSCFGGRGVCSLTKGQVDQLRAALGKP